MTEERDMFVFAMELAMQRIQVERRQNYLRNNGACVCSAAPELHYHARARRIGHLPMIQFKSPHQ